MSKIQLKYAVTITGYTERIPEYVDKGYLGGIDYIYCESYFLIATGNGCFEKVSSENWNTSKLVKSEWQDIHDALNKMYKHQCYGYIVTGINGILFNPNDYCNGVLWESETIKTDKGQIISVSRWDCESG